MTFFFKKNNVLVAAACLLVVAMGTYFFIRHLERTIDIQPITSFKDVDIQSLTHNISPKDVLIFFDIDDTVITSPEMILRESFIPYGFALRALVNHPKLLKTKNFEHIISIIFKEARRTITEPYVVDFIDQLKKDGYLVLGLTKTSSGEFGVIPDFPKFRYEQLKQFGITMSNHFPNTTFTELKPYKNRIPALYNGIIFCSEQPKGKVMQAFLKQFNYHPRVIMLFDDGIKNLVSVKKAAKEEHIPFYGFHYLAYVAVPGVWNTPRTLFQLDYLIQNSKWLSDEKADEMMPGEAKVLN
jgi:hypothetical protein